MRSRRELQVISLEMILKRSQSFPQQTRDPKQRCSRRVTTVIASKETFISPDSRKLAESSQTLYSPTTINNQTERCSNFQHGTTKICCDSCLYQNQQQAWLLRLFQSWPVMVTTHKTFKHGCLITEGDVELKYRPTAGTKRLRGLCS